MKNLNLSWPTMIFPGLGAQAGKMSLGEQNALGAFEFILGAQKTARKPWRGDLEPLDSLEGS